MYAVTIGARSRAQVAGADRAAVMAGPVLAFLVDAYPGSIGFHEIRVGVAAPTEFGDVGTAWDAPVRIRAVIGVHGGFHVFGELRIGVAAVTVVA